MVRTACSGRRSCRAGQPNASLAMTLVRSLKQRSHHHFATGARAWRVMPRWTSPVSTDAPRASISAGQISMPRDRATQRSRDARRASGGPLGLALDDRAASRFRLDNCSAAPSPCRAGNESCGVSRRTRLTHLRHGISLLCRESRAPRSPLLPPFRPANSHASLTSSEFRLQSFAFLLSMTRMLPISFIAGWSSFDLIETTSILRCCAIFNVVAQTAILSSFAHTNSRTSQRGQLGPNIAQTSRRLSRSQVTPSELDSLVRGPAWRLEGAGGVLMGGVDSDRFRPGRRVMRGTFAPAHAGC